MRLQREFTLNVDSHGSNGLHIWRVERIQTIRAHFSDTIAPEEAVTKVASDLRNDVGPSHDESSEEIITAIRPRLKERDLRASDDDALSQILHHEGQSGCSVGHCVRSMKDNETIKSFIVALK